MSSRSVGEQPIAPPARADGALSAVRAYFAQQLRRTAQQAPEPQQLVAEWDVALAEPTKAIAAMIIKRYFIESSC